MMLWVMSGLGFTFLVSSSLAHSSYSTLFLVSLVGEYKTLALLYCTVKILNIGTYLSEQTV